MAYRFLLVLIALGAAAYACGSEDADDDSSGTSSAGGAGGADACNGIGSPCNGSCPNGICYSSGVSPFCLPVQPPECGGFAGARCPAGAPNCLYLNGADFGPCLTDEVKDCVCLNSPGAVSGC